MKVPFGRPRYIVVIRGTVDGRNPAPVDI